MNRARADVTGFVSDAVFDQYDIDVSNSIIEQSLAAELISRDLLSTSGTIYQMILRSSSVGPVSSLLTCLLLAVAVSIVVACGSESGDTDDLACAGLETVTERAGLITRSEAEGLATEMLAMSAPEVTGMEIERVWSSCLTTHRSYEQDLLDRQGLSSPELRSPDMPVWVVEVKGISRPAGISAGNTAKTYNYAMVVMDAVSGESIAGARYQTPRMAPALGE